MLELMLKQQPQDGRCLFIDMNSFFASVEQQANPSFRGRPLAVCPFVTDATVAIAASVEAKRHGVKTGTKVPEAKRLCPGIILVEANPPLYREYHRRIMAELDNTPCQVLACSVDEALLIVPSYLRHRTYELALDIKQRIKKIGSQLQCSIGIGSSMFLAKMGTNLKKPDGLVEIKTTELASFYALLGLTDLHGIAWRMAKRLNSIGIHSPLDLYRSDFGLLRQNFGANGEAWYLRLRGFEVDLKDTQRRIIGHQSTIVPDPAKTWDEVVSVASQLAYRAAIRLRAADLAARGVLVYVRFQNRTYWKRIYHGRQPFYDSMTFFHHVLRLLKQLEMDHPVRLVSVSAIDLIPRRHLTASLFSDGNRQTREERLSDALDQINFRYGEATLVTAQQLLKDRIHDAIGFGNAVQNARELPTQSRFQEIKAKGRPMI